MIKKILFIMVLAIGITTIVITFYYYSATSYIAEYVALYTSISTACYAILAEPKQRTEPYLRITPLLERHHGMVVSRNFSTPSTAGITVWIENVGYSNATNIEVKCHLTPDASIPLKDKGVFKHTLLTPKESIRYEAVGRVETEKLLSQKLIIEVVYSNEDNKKQKPVKMECLVKDLEENLREVKTS
jgi:hypothetical protein